MLTARRKNRLERFRLDQRLRDLEKDSAKQLFRADRQRRSLLLGWQSVPLTTGYSDKAQPPDGPEDNVYEKSKHSRRRLPEKRLMQWKLREKQLGKFLWRFESQHFRGSSKQYRPKTVGTEPKASSSSRPLLQVEQNPAEVVKLFESKLKEFRLLQQQGGGSSYQTDGSASPTKRSISDRGASFVVDPKERDGKDPQHVDDTAPRSVKTTGAVSSCPAQNPRGKNYTMTTEDAAVTDANVIVKCSNPFLQLKMIHDLVASASDLNLNREDFVRAHSRAAATRFLVTKNKVVMKSTAHGTCKQIHTNKSSTDDTRDSPCSLEHRDFPDNTRCTSRDTDIQKSNEKTGKKVDFTRHAHVNTNTNHGVKATRNDELDSIDGHVRKVADLSSDNTHDGEVRSFSAREPECEKHGDWTPQREKDEFQLAHKDVSVAQCLTEHTSDHESTNYCSYLTKTSVDDSEKKDADSSESRQEKVCRPNSMQDTLPKARRPISKHGTLSKASRPNSQQDTSSKTCRPGSRQGKVMSKPSTPISRQGTPKPSTPISKQDTPKPSTPFSKQGTPKRSTKISKQDTLLSEDGQRYQSKWRRDLIIEQPVGLRGSSSGHTLGSEARGTMAFSKTARQRALTSMVDENSLDIRKAVRTEKVRKLQSRVALLHKIAIQFPMKEDLGI